ncbi:MAG: ABC transporter permease [Bacillota bacterium]|nr:ABC transporter permease [Bacillota bacterium]
MKAVYKRELNSYLNNPMGYVFLGIFVLFFSVIFCYINLYSLVSSNISYTFSYMIYAMLVLMPLLTMRLMSEEKAQKTDQLLLTAPVKASSIILGKFFAAMTLVLLALVFTLPHIVILVIQGNPGFLVTLLAYIGFILYSSVYVSIGIFISSLTENQVISAVLTFAIFMGLLALEILFVPGIQSPTLYKILSGISFASRYSDFSMGVFNLTSLVYYASAAFLFLFFTVRVTEKRRWA